jgi:hypothetical protein
MVNRILVMEKAVETSVAVRGLHSMPAWSAGLAVAVTLLMLSGCGQKGALTLPKSAPASAPAR